jgi:hypothetical protein
MPASLSSGIMKAMPIETRNPAHRHRGMWLMTQKTKWEMCPANA